MLVRDFLAKTDIRQAVLYMRLSNDRMEDPFCTGKPDRRYTEKEWEEKQVSVFSDFVECLLPLRPSGQAVPGEPGPEGAAFPACSDNVILGMRCLDFLDPGTEIVDLAVYVKRDLGGWKEAILADMRVPDPDMLSDDEVSQLLAGLCETDSPRIEDIPHGRAFKFVPWEEILGWEVDPGNIALCGEDAFAAALLEEMSFNGLYREDQDTRRAELDEAVQESERIKALPEEEQDGHFVKADDLFAELYAELGEEYTPLTEEEKEAERRQINRDMLQNRRLRGIYLGAYLGLSPENTGKENGDV